MMNTETFYDHLFCVKESERSEKGTKVILPYLLYRCTVLSLPYLFYFADTVMSRIRYVTRLLTTHSNIATDTTTPEAVKSLSC